MSGFVNMTNVKDFLDKLRNGQKCSSEDLLCNIKQGIERVKDEDNMKTFVEEILAITTLCESNNFKSATSRASSVLCKYQTQIKRIDEILKDVTRNHEYPNKDKQVRDCQQLEDGHPLEVPSKLNEKSHNYESFGNKQTDKVSLPQRANDGSRTQPSNNDPRPRQSKTEYDSHENCLKEKESKLASPAVHYNNPNIADLSDFNRPTNVAERFSELYDNEWTEAFEELTNRDGTKERQAIAKLLDFVQQAYTMCRNEAEKQMTQIVTAIQNILESGDANKSSSKQTSNIPNVEGKHFLVEYRKSIADLSLKRLLDVFSENLLRLNDKGKKKTTTQYDRLALYVRKCIELSWWMCVHDPPVDMCNKSDSHLYRAYTKSGATVDYIVWPTLKLYQEGPILFKGIAQFK